MSGKADSLRSKVTAMACAGMSNAEIIAALPDHRPHSVIVQAAKVRKAFAVKPNGARPSATIDLPEGLWLGLCAEARRQPTIYSAPSQLAIRIISVVLQDKMLGALFEDYTDAATGTALDAATGLPASRGTPSRGRPEA